jgi:hypothetical protein
MRRNRLLPGLLSGLLVVMLAVAGCGKDGGNDITGPGGTGGGGTGGGGGGGGGGGTVNSDPTDNGGWPNPDGTTPTPTPVDTSVYEPPTDPGSAGSDGTSTAILFQTSGAARYGLGTCGANGTWTAPNGQQYGPYNPNCILYASDSTAGTNGKGMCVTSDDGDPGLWLNPQMHPTSPYHTKCLRLGEASTALALSFPAQAELYTAKDGSGGKILNFVSGGTVVAQLIYDPATDATTGSGVLVGHDGSVPWHFWSIGFGQPALNFTGALTNGDVIAGLMGSGVEVVACSTAVGCSLVTLEIQ